METMQQILESNGFRLLRQCSCGGTHTMTFGKSVNLKKYEVAIRPNRKTWTLNVSNTRIDSGKEELLTQKLIEHEVIKSI
jgi:hypothetical protein